MSVTTSGRMSLTAIFGMVTTTANALTQTVETAGKSVSMLSRFVDKAAEEQLLHHEADLAMLEDRIVEEKAMEAAQRQLEVLTFCKQSAEHEAAYKANLTRIREILQNRSNRRLNTQTAQNTSTPASAS